MTVSRMDEARLKVGETVDPNLRDFMKFGLTSLFHIEKIDGDVDAVALLDVLRYLHAERATLRAILDGTKVGYRWSE